MIGIAMVDQNGALNSNGVQPIHLKKDLARFHQLTDGKVVVMGRKTLEQLPGGRPLRNRLNIVLTRQSPQTLDSYDNLVYAHSEDDIYEIIRQYKPIHEYTSDDIVIIGGGEIYKTYAASIDEFIITSVNIEFPNPTAYLQLPDYFVKSKFDLVEKDYDRTTGDSFNTMVSIYTSTFQAYLKFPGRPKVEP